MGAFSSSESDSSLLELASFFLAAAATAGVGAGAYRQATHAFYTTEHT